VNADFPVPGSPLLTDRVAVVTGAASGIGRAIALAFAAHGARAVVIADRRRDPREGGPATDELILAHTGCEAEFVACDVTSANDVTAAVAAADRFGGIDVMVNVAGITEPGPFLELDDEAIDRLLAVNVRGVIHGCQSALRAMAGRGGAIVNMSSVTGMVASLNPVYSGSKAAVGRMTASLAARYGREGIRVNSVHPGFIQTAMTSIDIPVLGTEAERAQNAAVPLGRSGTPADVADATVFLASDMARFITGTSIVVDGGWSCQLPSATATVV
jgi:NAD(P)-dependent dehydrogenase (short-subunit alcohol dehydrogenase family)